MPTELNGYGPTAGDYMGGTGDNLNAHPDNSTPNGNSGGSGNVNGGGNGASGNPELVQSLNNIGRHEGMRSQMYLDTKGNVTVGIGEYMANADAAALPFKTTHHESMGHGETRDRLIDASDSQKRSEYNQMKSGQLKTGTLSLTIGDMQKLANDHITANRQLMRGLYSDFDTLPSTVRIALDDMSFNLGFARLRDEFPRFNAAVNSKDYITAATESHRTGIGDARNKDTHDQILAGVGH